VAVSRPSAPLSSAIEQDDSRSGGRIVTQREVGAKRGV
jgi:hypothetical protein